VSGEFLEPNFDSDESEAETGSLTPSPGAVVGSPASSSTLPSPPDRRFLSRAGKARVYVTQGGGRPLDLVVDAVVIPTDFRADFSGTFASYAMSILGPSWSGFESAVQADPVKDFLAPERPVFHLLFPASDQRRALTLIAASPWLGVSETAALEGVDRAVRAVIALSRNRSIRSLAIPLLGARGGGLTPVRVVRTLITAAESALPQAPWIEELTVIAQEDEAYQEAIALFTLAPQRFANDLPGGDDLLDVAGEIQALTDVLLLKSLQPPLAVGILGGWGSGKSFVMDLMRRHIQRIRSLPPQSRWDKGTPGDYVGHIYPITFDAWTYAKSNLWASLMQTIFLELSRQVRLEQRIRQRPEMTDELEAGLWLAFQDLTDRDREVLIERGVLASTLADLSTPREQLDGEAGGALWKVVSTVREKQKVVLGDKHKEIVKNAAEIEKKRAELEGRLEQKLTDKAYQIAWQGSRSRCRI
jgi:KAP-like P-loop domain-containing protein